MALMARYPDKFFYLAIVDPPYSALSQKGSPSSRYNRAKKVNILCQKWDVIPEEAYFSELKRISKKHIIFGANYFPLSQPDFTIVLDKKNKLNLLNDAEIAFGYVENGYKNSGVRCFYFSVITDWEDGKRIHPTQKPVALYKWLLSKYAKPGQKILDTHLGSGSIAIACLDLGFELTACEIDREYFDKAMSLIKGHEAQASLFEKKEIQELLFGGEK